MKPVEDTRLCAVRVLVMAGWTHPAIARGFGVHQVTIGKWAEKAKIAYGPFRRMESIRRDALPDDLGALFAAYGHAPALLPRRWPWTVEREASLMPSRLTVVPPASAEVVSADLGPIADMLRSIRQDTQALLGHGEIASTTPDVIDTSGVLAMRWLAGACVEMLGLEAVAEYLEVNLRVVRTFLDSSKPLISQVLEDRLPELKALFAIATMADQGLDEDDIRFARRHLRARERRLAATVSVAQAQGGW